jgi:hypothetical protein
MMTGRIWAQLAAVALAEAREEQYSVRGDGAEVVRLRVLAGVWEKTARRLGFDPARAFEVDHGY